MAERSPPSDGSKTLWRRLDRWIGHLNVFLLVIAIGLGVLDLSCFWAIEVNQLTRPGTISAETLVPARLSSPSAAAPQTLTTAAYLPPSPPTMP